MQDLNAEDKQALIWRCRDAVAHLKQVVEVGVRGGRYSVTEYRYQLMINEIALASLTAKPVKLPKSERVANGYYFDMNDVFVALESAGVKFEVQE